MPDAPPRPPDVPARPPLRRLLKHLLALFVACFAASLWAGSIDVWITQESPLQQAFVDALTPALADAGHEIGTIVNSAAVVSPAPSSARVVVALGMNATLSALRQSDATVLATLLSKRDAERVLSEYGTQRLAAIVLDQPVERRLRLLEQLVPDVESVVVLLGNRTASHRGKIEDAIRAAGLAPRIAVINEPAEIVAKLEALLDPQAALLTVPDPEVYNRDTVMGILLTTYRHRRPVIGFTAAYVRAGAVAAVYSDPQDIAMQVVQLLTTAGSLADFPRGILAPSRFRVAINERVSRSLGLPVISELETLERLRAAEAAK